jgi:hypothetical protein
MAREHIEAAINLAEPRTEGEWQVVAEGRSLTLYVAKEGSTLQITRVEAVAWVAPLVKARTTSGEVFVVAPEDVFAAAALGAGDARSKKAGFI